jgi:hypothetical protein
MKVEFVSYDGDYPNLCSGTLVMSVDGNLWKFDSHSLSSGGSVSFDDNWSEEVTDGEWGIHTWPDDYPEEAEDRTVELVNENVHWGCCGGCV